MSLNCRASDYSSTKCETLSAKSGCRSIGSLKLQAIKAELRRRMHSPPALVGEWLHKVTLGYYQYHAVPGNSPQLRIFTARLGRLWRLVLMRRSQRGYVRWDRLQRLFARWIPQPRVLHPHPMQRFDATHPRWKPYA